MMPVVRISDQTWERLKGYARPLEDTPDDVIQRALDALDNFKDTSLLEKRSEKQLQAESSKAKTVNVLGRAKLPQKEFRAPLIQTLQELGGTAFSRDIRDRIEPKVAPLLSKADYELVKSGDPRWWNAICWERNELVKEGIFKSNSPRGIWELA